MGCGVSSGPIAHQPAAAGGPGGAYARNGGAPQATVVRPQQLPQANAQHVPNSETQKSAPLMRSLVNLHRDSLEWSSDSSGSSLTFRFDTSGESGCEISVHLLVHETATEGAVPSFDGARETQRETFRKGLRQTCKVNFSATDLVAAVAAFGAEKDGYFHLVIDIAACSLNGEIVMGRQLSYIKLSFAEDKTTVSMSKQKAVSGNICSELSTLYGTFARGKGNDAGGEGTDCVICLTNTRDTVIIPCRHVCLCSGCAAVTSSTWSFQCPVCRARVAAMVKLGEEVGV